VPRIQTKIGALLWSKYSTIASQDAAIIDPSLIAIGGFMMVQSAASDVSFGFIFRGTGLSGVWLAGISVSRKSPLDRSRRAENLRLLRAYMNVLQEDLSKTLRLNSQPYYSTVERGKKQLAESEARRIETNFGLPPGWMDRNNIDGLLLSRVELELINELRDAPAGTIELLTVLAKGMKAANALTKH
jgi:hypothetical protein